MRSATDVVRANISRVGMMRSPTRGSWSASLSSRDTNSLEEEVSREVRDRCEGMVELRVLSVEFRVSLSVTWCGEWAEQRFLLRDYGITLVQ